MDCYFKTLNLQKNRKQWPAETGHCAPYNPILLLALPFYHLRSDGFWYLVSCLGKEAIVEAGVVMRSISKL